MIVIAGAYSPVHRDFLVGRIGQVSYRRQRLRTMRRWASPSLWPFTFYGDRNFATRVTKWFWRQRLMGEPPLLLLSMNDCRFERKRQGKWISAWFFCHI
jgi:hypothetical protein